LLLGGGAHASSFPEETLQDLALDIVVVGEGDYTLPEILSGKQWRKIKGICFKQKGKIIMTRRKDFIENLDQLPYPSWSLYDLPRYQTSPLLSRANPAGWMETSRGCPYGCVYCNKSVFGRTFRIKSASRVVDEMEFMLKSGLKEIHIADDNFTSDMERAEEICEEIIKRGLKFPWATITGIRVDRVNKGLLRKMKRAGCYRVYFGIESGSQRVLNNINKGINLKQIRQAINWAKKAGLETFGFFMIALPGEKLSDIKKTIKFATSLDLDMAKMSVTIPLPATPLYNELKNQGKIKTKNWSEFNLYLPAPAIYDHPNLDWETIDKYYSLFYRRFYFHPRFITKRFLFCF
jgi:anaerobic magnesium-protoporphyrin IX monomethyl ester cyclase